MLELLFRPHVETERADHAHVDTESTMDTRAINANENGVRDGGPIRLELSAVEAAIVLFLLSHSLEHG